MTRVKNTSLFLLLTFALSMLYKVAQSQTHNLNAINKIVSIKDYYAGKIPISVIKSATQLNIKSPYKFISATVYFSSTLGTGDVTMTSLQGNTFNKNLLSYWSRITATTVITFDNIKVVKNGKKKNLAGVSFIVSTD